MKTFLLTIIVVFSLCVSNITMAQYDGCPHGLSAAGSQIAYLNWRFIDTATGQVVTGAPNPQPDKVYRMEIFQTGAPAGTGYVNIGIQGTADGFKIYTNETDANNSSNPFSDSQISSGIGPDVGADKTARFYIRTLPSSDPNWSSQLTAFKAYGICYPSTIGYPNKFYKKTLTFTN